MKTNLTPLEQLKARKQQLQFEAQIRQNKIGNNFQYIQHHGGKLVLNTVTSAVLPKRATGVINSLQPASRTSSIANLALGGASTLLKGNKAGLLPIVWGIAQPFILTWGIKGAKKFIGGLFSRKKKKKK